MAAMPKKSGYFFSGEPWIIYACINDGFFEGNQSYSLVKYSNDVISPNIKAVNRNYNGNNTAYFPTRAVFGFNTSGVPAVS